MRGVAPHRVPTGVQEENIRHILKRAEAFDILIEPPRLDTPELLQRGDYLLSGPGSNEDIGSLRAGACKSLCSPISPMSDSHHSDASGMSLASSLPDVLHITKFIGRLRIRSLGCVSVCSLVRRIC